MSWVAGPDGAYALISVEEWEQLDAALREGDIERARELLEWWQPAAAWSAAISVGSCKR